MSMVNMENKRKLVIPVGVTGDIDDVEGAIVGATDGGIVGHAEG